MARRNIAAINALEKPTRNSKEDIPGTERAFICVCWRIDEVDKTYRSAVLSFCWFFKMKMEIFGLEEEEDCEDCDCDDCEDEE